MPSLRANFDELMERVRQGRDVGHASFEPVYYLVFPPGEILEVKRSMPAWIARLRNEGWEVTRFSMAEHIAAILSESRLRKRWLDGDRKAPLDWQKTNDSLAYAVTNGSNALQVRLKAQLDALHGQSQAILLVTDLEALHAYTRIGVIEGQLYGSFTTPTIFFYPGERTGKSRLRFLGFYPEDGNYRSVHVGG